MQVLLGTNRLTFSLKKEIKAKRLCSSRPRFKHERFSYQNVPCCVKRRVMWSFLRVQTLIIDGPKSDAYLTSLYLCSNCSSWGGSSGRRLVIWLFLAALTIWCPMFRRRGMAMQGVGLHGREEREAVDDKDANYWILFWWWVAGY